MNRTVGGTARPSHHLRGAASVSHPRTAISKYAMDFTHDYGLSSPQSTMPPEIALREPLDKEFSLNRKMAKKQFERSLRDQMQTNRSMRLTDRDNWTRNLFAKETKKEKDIATQKKAEDLHLRNRIQDRKAMEDDRRYQR